MIGFESEDELRKYLEDMKEESERKQKELGMTVDEYFQHCLKQLKASSKVRADYFAAIARSGKDQ